MELDTLIDTDQLTSREAGWVNKFIRQLKDRQVVLLSHCDISVITEFENRGMPIKDASDIIHNRYNCRGHFVSRINGQPPMIILVKEYANKRNDGYTLIHEGSHLRIREIYDRILQRDKNEMHTAAGNHIDRLFFADEKNSDVWAILEELIIYRHDKRFSDHSNMELLARVLQAYYIEPDSRMNLYRIIYLTFEPFTTTDSTFSFKTFLNLMVRLRYSKVNRLETATHARFKFFYDYLQKMLKDLDVPEEERLIFDWYTNIP